MDDKLIYVRNVSDAPVTVKLKDKASGKVVLEKRFLPAIEDKWTGARASTGYTTLTEEEYKALSKDSRTFRHFKDDIKQLVASEELPAEAKSPHEALRDARKEARQAAGEAGALKAENDSLKTALAEAETRYKELQSASTDAEKLKPLQDRIAALKAENAGLKAALAEAEKKAGGKKGKDFE